MSKYFMADFETTTSTYSREETAVWAWALCDIQHAEDIDDVIIGTSIREFMYYCDNQLPEEAVVYFHNLNFDGAFIISWLLYNNINPVEFKKQSKSRRGYQLLSSDTGGYYFIKVKLKNKVITYANSLKIIPGSVKSIGESFKTKHRKLDLDFSKYSLGSKIDTVARRYIANDVLVVAEAMRFILSDGHTKLTAGSNAMANFIEMFGGKKVFRQWFPELDKEEHDFARQAYKGGIVQVKKGAESKIYENLYAYDVHSMYPGRMHSSSGCLFPYGKGEWFDHAPKSEEKKVWIARVSVSLRIRREHMPCLQIKGGRFRDNEYLTETDGQVTITVTQPEWELICEQYEMETSPQWEGGYSYHAKTGLFDEFIEYWYEIKQSSSGALKQLAKLIINSFYGKFATSTKVTNMYPYLDEKGVVKHARIDGAVKPLYMPVGVFTTAYSRTFLVQTCQRNYEAWLYCDTDSGIFQGEYRELDITEDTIGTWGDDGYYKAGKFLRQKTYLLQREDNTYKVRCAGLPDNKIRDKINFDNFDYDYNFESPDSIYKNCKFAKRTVKGGVLLLETDFKIRRA